MIFAFFFLFLVFTITITNSKHVLVVVFPTGKDKNLNMVSLFANSLASEECEPLKYDVVIEENESKLWKKELKAYSITTDTDISPINFYSFTGFYDLPELDIDDLPKKPQFQFFQKYLRGFYQGFLDSGVLEKLSNKKYDIIISDRPNFIAIILQKRLNIQLKMYLSMRPIPQLFYKNLELNPSYYPAVSSDLINVMTYGERCKNFFNFISDKIIFWMSRYEIKYLFSTYGHKDITTDYFFKGGMTLIQYPMGIAFPLSVPPNFKLLNSIAIDINMNQSFKFDQNLSKFMSKYEKIILITKNIYYHVLNSTIINSIITKNANVNKMKTGFVLLQKLLLTETASLPDNAFMVNISDYTLRDELTLIHKLMNNTKVSLMITPAELNEISISLYYSKPFISIGDGLYQHNINGFIRANLLGIVIGNKEMNKVESYEKAIRDLYDDEDEDEDENEINIYKKNAIKLSKILRHNKKANDEYIKWINYGFNNGYETLNIDAYEIQYWFSLFGLDVFITFLIPVLIILYLLIKLIIKILGGWINKGQKATKEKVKTD